MHGCLYGEKNYGKGQAVLELALALTAQEVGADPFLPVAGDSSGSTAAGAGVSEENQRSSDSGPGFGGLGGVFADYEEDLSQAVKEALDEVDNQNQ